MTILSDDELVRKQRGEILRSIGLGDYADAEEDEFKSPENERTIKVTQIIRKDKHGKKES